MSEVCLPQLAVTNPDTMVRFYLNRINAENPQDLAEAHRVIAEQENPHMRALLLGGLLVNSWHADPPLPSVIGCNFPGQHPESRQKQNNKTD